MGVEIKASGLSQTWNPANTSTPRFDIHKQLQWWDADSDTWASYDPPQRTADIYVFCLHEAVPATNENVADLSQWRFWIVPTSVLNQELDSQKSVGVTTLNGLAEPVSFSEIKTAVEVFLRGEEAHHESALTATRQAKNVVARCMSCKEKHKVTVHVDAWDKYFWFDRPLHEVWPTMTEAQARVLIADKNYHIGHGEGHNSYECQKCENLRSGLHDKRIN